MRAPVLSLFAAGLLATGAAAAAPAAKTARPTSADRLLLPPSAKVGKESFGALTARWWQWAGRMPLPPFLDIDGSLCDVDQDGPVWFLAGTDGNYTAKRTCVVPAGRYLLVPIINMRVSTRRNPDGSLIKMSCKAFQQAAAVNNDRLGSAVVLIDGVPVTHVAQYRVRSDGCFPLDPDGNPAIIAASDGYWLLIKPLPPGQHKLVVGANYATDEYGYGRMVQNFEYLLHVGAKTDLL